jgi:hypothetical protein
LASGALVLASVLAFFWQPLRAVVEPGLGGAGVEVPWNRPAAGFLMEITSEPSGARFAVNGEERGQTPALANVLCLDGQEVEIAVDLEGFAPYRRTVVCREGGRLQVRARLER